MAATPVPHSENSSNRLSGNPLARNFADCSFEKILLAAQDRLFRFPRLEFDFNLPKNDTEISEPSQEAAYHEETIIQDAPPPRYEEPQEPLGQIAFENATTKALKEILTKNIPLPAPAFMSVFAGSISEGISFTKQDMQVIINEIVKQAKLIKTGEKTALQLSLFQKDLGELFVSFVFKNGQVAINIFAHDQVKKIIEQNITELELALKKSQINLDSIKISEIKQTKT